MASQQLPVNYLTPCILLFAAQPFIAIIGAVDPIGVSNPGKENSMFKPIIRRYVQIAVALCLVLVFCGAFAPGVLAQDSAANPGSIRQALEQQVGKRAKLKLVSGQDLEGKVSEVGNEVVIVNELTGMEFFGATVRIDQVAAVIVRKQ
jgi:hypothetical protein